MPPGKKGKDRISAITDWGKRNKSKRFLYTLRSRAKRAGMEFNLTEEDVLIPDVCPILKIPLFFPDNGRSDNTPSADRVDNSKGYIKGNVRFISLAANIRKGDMTIEQVERLLSYMKGEL